MGQSATFFVVVGIEGNTRALVQESGRDTETTPGEEVDVDRDGGGEAGMTGAVFVKGADLDCD